MTRPHGERKGREKSLRPKGESVLYKNWLGKCFRRMSFPSRGRRWGRGGRAMFSRVDLELQSYSEAAHSF